MESASLQQPVEIHGRGLFSGEECTIRLEPAQEGNGIVFIVDAKKVPAHPNSVQPASNFTLLSAEEKEVRVPEHLLCALWAARIDTLNIVQLAGAEIPNIDGSAQPFFEAIRQAGRQPLGARRAAQIRTDIHLGTAEAHFLLEPSASLVVEYHFDHPELGNQRYLFNSATDKPEQEFLPARTFATRREAEAAQAAKLLRNTDETAGLLITDGIPNQPLRFDTEFARHKTLDLLGDLYLLPFDWTCKLTAYRTGHQMNHQLASKLLALVEAGEIPLI